jgi:hypothetical protein
MRREERILTSDSALDGHTIVSMVLVGETVVLGTLVLSVLDLRHLGNLFLDGLDFRYSVGRKRSIDHNTWWCAGEREGPAMKELSKHLSLYIMTERGAKDGMTMEREGRGKPKRALDDSKRGGGEARSMAT